MLIFQSIARIFLHRCELANLPVRRTCRRKALIMLLRIGSDARYFRYFASRMLVAREGDCSGRVIGTRMEECFYEFDGASETSRILAPVALGRRIRIGRLLVQPLNADKSRIPDQTQLSLSAIPRRNGTRDCSPKTEGSYLRRSETRALLGLSSQDPPRTTRPCALAGPLGSRAAPLA